MDEKIKEELFFTDYEIEVLSNRAAFFGRLGNIQSKYSLPSFSIIEYYARKMKINPRKEIPFDVETKLVDNCQRGNKLIIKNIKDVCRVCTLNEEEQENFYRLILDNGYVCDYFLSNNSNDIIKEISTYNCAPFDKLLALIKNIDPNFDYNEYNYINNK